MRHTIQESFTTSLPTTTFVERLRHKSGSGAHLVRTYDARERPCWFLLRASELDLMKLERTAYGEMIDLTRFGAVVAAGWGHTPDERALNMAN